MRRRDLASIVVGLMLVIPATLSAWQGEVIEVREGALVKVRGQGGDREVRLYGTETPRQGQGFFAEARKFTEQNLTGKTVEVTPVEEDPSGRVIGIITMEGFQLNKELVRYGFAWVNRAVCRRPECNEWNHWQEQAQFLGAGLWSSPKPVPPWEYGKAAAAPEQAATGAPTAEAIVYRGNVSSRYFHAPGCKYYDNPKCTALFNSAEEALKAGYKPHRQCIPVQSDKPQ
jgi:endonuclease YncB( thermonuclease family)